MIDYLLDLGKPKYAIMNSDQIEAMIKENNLAKTEKELLIELLEVTKRSNDLAITRNRLLDRIKGNVVFFTWFIVVSLIATFLIAFVVPIVNR